MSVNTKEKTDAIKRKLAEATKEVVAGAISTNKLIEQHALELIDLQTKHNKRINDAFSVISDLKKRIDKLESGGA